MATCRARSPASEKWLAKNKWLNGLQSGDGQSGRPGFSKLIARTLNAAPAQKQTNVIIIEVTSNACLMLSSSNAV
jgi:hypothetical protein